MKQVGFQRQGEAYRKGPSVVLRRDDVGGRARVTTDEERVAYYTRTLNIDEVMKVWRLGNCEKFVGTR